jgi:hypothetical protein
LPAETPGKQKYLFGFTFLAQQQGRDARSIDVCELVSKIFEITMKIFQVLKLLNYQFQQSRIPSWESPRQGFQPLLQPIELVPPIRHHRIK